MNIPSKTAVLATVPSDCHSWNLVFMQLLLSEMGYFVVNLGVCVPYNLVVEKCIEHDPSALIISTINGHGYIEGVELAKRIRRVTNLTNMHLAIGGKINTDPARGQTDENELLKAGFNVVYRDSRSLSQFMSKMSSNVHVDQKYTNCAT